MPIPLTRSKIPTLIITGFLGSGKTTLIKQLLQTSLAGKKVALIENEIGEVSIDAAILKTENVSIRELSSGCLCCTVSGDFLSAISDILNNTSPDVLLVETTGIANPISVFYMLAADRRLLLDAIITVADAENLMQYLDDTSVAEIQLTIADVIILNKIDTVSESAVAALEATIRGLTQRAAIFKTREAKIPSDIFFGTSHNVLRDEIHALEKRADDQIKTRAAERGIALQEHHHVGHTHGAAAYHLDVDEIESFVVEINGKFSKRKFENFLSALKGVYRAKGIVHFAEDASPVIFNFTSGRFVLDYDTLSHETSQDAVFKNQLVFIGQKILVRKTEIESALGACQV
jgi:G3E family GTPase